ncbi:MAG TPA: hypothetical protein VF796_18890, partial [Humisphaera sp.]
AATLEAGYEYAASYLHGLAPDLVIGGHSWVIDKPAELIARYGAWAAKMKAALVAVTGEADYRLAFDPYQVRADPYRVSLARGETREILLHVRNYADAPQAHRIRVDCGDGVDANPRVLEGRVAAESSGAFAVRLSAARDAVPGVKLVTFDATLGGRAVGPWFDMIVRVT